MCPLRPLIVSSLSGRVLLMMVVLRSQHHSSNSKKEQRLAWLHHAEGNCAKPTVTPAAPMHVNLLLRPQLCQMFPACHHQDPPLLPADCSYDVILGVHKAIRRHALPSQSCWMVFTNTVLLTAFGFGKPLRTNLLTGCATGRQLP